MVCSVHVAAVVWQGLKDSTIHNFYSEMKMLAQALEVLNIIIIIV